MPAQEPEHAADHFPREVVVFVQIEAVRAGRVVDEGDRYTANSSHRVGMTTLRAFMRTQRAIARLKTRLREFGVNVG